jgi:hypothetical protein
MLVGQKNRAAVPLQDTVVLALRAATEHVHCSLAMQASLLLLANLLSGDDTTRGVAQSGSGAAAVSTTTTATPQSDASSWLPPLAPALVQRCMLALDDSPSRFVGARVAALVLLGVCVSRLHGSLPDDTLRDIVARVVTVMHSSRRTAVVLPPCVDVLMSMSRTASGARLVVVGGGVSAVLAAMDAPHASLRLRSQCCYLVARLLSHGAGVATDVLRCGVVQRALVACEARPVDVEAATAACAVLAAAASSSTSSHSADGAASGVHVALACGADVTLRRLLQCVEASAYATHVVQATLESLGA